MKKVITALEAKENDAYTISNFTPSIDLMEKAGEMSFKLIKEKIKKEEKILIVAGGGGNGGDGLVIARYLFNENYDVSIYLASNHLKEETSVNLKRYLGKIIDDLDIYLKKYKPSVIIDALFGVGLSTKIKDSYIELINKLNQVNAYKVSIDINSGLDATSGLNLGTYFKMPIINLKKSCLPNL